MADPVPVRAEPPVRVPHPEIHPLLGPGHDFASVTDKISSIVQGESLSFDWEWWVQSLDQMPVDQVRQHLRSVTDRIVLHRRGKGR